MIYAVLRRGRLFHRFLGWFFTDFKRAVERLLQAVRLKLIGLPVKLSAVIPQKQGTEICLHKQVSISEKNTLLAGSFTPPVPYSLIITGIFLSANVVKPVYLGSHFSYFSLVAAYCRKRLTIPAWIPIK